MRQREFEAEAWLLPFLLCGVCAGFPSPADDHMKPGVDRLELLKRPGEPPVGPPMAGRCG